MTTATFLYRGETVTIEPGERQTVIRCPVCGQCRRLPPELFQVTVDAQGRPTISRFIRCPTPECGWAVWVIHGQATDILEERPSAPRRRRRRSRLRRWISGARPGDRTR